MKNTGRQELAMFIMRVYVPTYFSVKNRFSCTNGSIHFFNVTKYSRYLPPNLFAVIKETCPNNPYFAHSENLLLAMISDENVEVRKRGYQKILLSREGDEQLEQGFDGVRPYIHPFDSETYYEMIDWNLAFTEPPFTRGLSHEELMKTVRLQQIKFGKANGRHFKLVTEVASRYTTHQCREGAVAAILEGRGQILKTLPGLRCLSTHKNYVN